MAREIDVIEKQAQPALSQVSGEEEAAAAAEVSTIVRHYASMAFNLSAPVMGFASLYPSYALRTASMPGGEIRSELRRRIDCRPI
jgi:hypothetical protein